MFDIVDDKVIFMFSEWKDDIRDTLEYRGYSSSPDDVDKVFNEIDWISLEDKFFDIIDSLVDNKAKELGLKEA